MKKQPLRVRVAMRSRPDQQKRCNGWRFAQRAILFLPASRSSLTVPGEWRSIFKNTGGRNSVALTGTKWQQHGKNDAYAGILPQSGFKVGRSESSSCPLFLTTSVACPPVVGLCGSGGIVQFSYGVNGRLLNDCACPLH